MTTASQVVARQLDRSGSTLLDALSPVDPGEFFAENVNGLSAAWVTGHLACVTDLISSWFDGVQLFGRDFHQVFNDTSLTAAGPAGVDRDLYPKGHLLLWFRQAVVRALRTLGEFGPGRWDDSPPPGVPASLLTGGEVWERLAVHVYWHSGELAGSMSRFRDTHTLNPMSPYFYIPGEQPA